MPLPDAPQVNLFINNVKVSGVLTIPPATPGALAYPGLFPGSEYVTVTPGTASISAVVPATGATTLSLDVPVADGRYYSVFAVDSAKKITSLVVEDMVDNSIAADMAYIRFIHLIPNGPSVDLAFSSGTTFATASAQTLFTNSAFKQVSDYVPVEPGTYSFQLRRNGLTTAVATLTNQTFEANRTYTIYARGFIGGTSALVPALTRYINK